MSIIVDNIRLPEHIERNSRGGPSFQTTILTGANFDETAIQNWATERRVWDISYGVNDREDFTTVLNFFRGRRGAARAFLFKDWTDYEMDRRQIGTGDGTETEFTLLNEYADTVLPYYRRITRPILSTLNIYLGGTATTAYSFDRGTITFTNAPAADATIEAECQFDIPVRFDTDTIQVELFWESAGRVPTIPIREVTDE